MAALVINTCHIFTIAILFVFCCKPINPSLNSFQAYKDDHSSVSNRIDKYSHSNVHTNFDPTIISVNRTYSRNEACFYAIVSAGLVGLTGIVPLLLLPSFKSSELNEEKNARKLKRLLSFAVGSLLGDVFLHLLPESWEHLHKQSFGFTDHWIATIHGLWILFGIISFCMLEKLFPEHLLSENSEECFKESESDLKENNFIDSTNNNVDLSKKLANGTVIMSKDHPNTIKSLNDEYIIERKPQAAIKTSGYLNLFANCIDNFTHGLAVGGSYLVSLRVGILTTFAILLHEIPHEVGDFAILLRAGFNQKQAVKYQLLTASGGLLGAWMAFFGDSIQSPGDQLSWILPFTSGGFIYVALCTVVPDLLKETSPRESFIQMFCLLIAVGVMFAVSFI